MKERIEIRIEQEQIVAKAVKKFSMRDIKVLRENGFLVDGNTAKLPVSKAGIENTLRMNAKIRGGIWTDATINDLWRSGKWI